MKIVIDRRIPGLKDQLEAMNPECAIVAKEGADITREDVRDAHALFVRTRTRCDSCLLEGSGVRLLGSATIGTDHIDIPWCEQHGIKVVNAPGCNAPAVMQYVAACLQRAGFDPSSHTLGIIGKGHIGSLVAALYRKAGARVLVSDPPRKDAGDTEEDYLSLEEVLAGSDAVTFHVPYTKEGKYSTRHLLTKELLVKYARPQIIVNTSRGLVLEPGAIDNRRKFIIDTWPFEDEPQYRTEVERRRIVNTAFIATPHIAGYSIQGKRRATDAMLLAFRQYFSAQQPIVTKIDEPDVEYSLSDVISSFDPMPLSYALKKDPSSFEILRGSHLRPEPNF